MKNLLFTIRAVRTAVLPLALLAGLAVPSIAFAQTDIDGDGVDDVLSEEISSDGLLWTSSPSAADGEALSQVFGVSGDLPVPGEWLEPGTLSLGILRVGSSRLTAKVLRPEGDIGSLSFGKKGDVVLTGGDFDGNGIADIASVRVEKGNLAWTFYHDALSYEPGKTRRFVFGKPGGRVFYLNLDGTQDWVGYTAYGAGRRSAKLVLKNVVTRTVRTLRRFPKQLMKDSRPRPFPVRMPTGEDAIGYSITTVGETAVWVYDTRGKLIDKREFPGTGTLFVGDIRSDLDGEEVLLLSGSTLTVMNPFSKVFFTESRTVSGTPLDTYHVITTGTD